MTGDTDLTRGRETRGGNGGSRFRLLPSERSDISSILALAKSKGAADVHLVAGSPLLFRIQSELVPITRQLLGAETVRHLSYCLLNSEQIERFERDLDIDFMTTSPDHMRYRVNVSYNDGKVGAVIRLLPGEPLPLEEIRLPESVTRLTRARKGLILITGSTSQGKTTTLASLIDAINRRHRKHIVTIEDPVEYLHINKNSIIRQREVGRDTHSFAHGLRAALRQDADIIAIGEMRDYETIKIALTAAEAGVLVLSTLHIISIDKIIERLLAYAPEGGHGQIRTLLAEALLCVIHQELLPTPSGGKRVASEVLFATEAVRNLIRNRGTYHLRSVVAMGQRFGMQTMRASLDQLRDEGMISDSLHRLVLEHYQ
ncbi:MAG: PilT/PilU family type 4a pilus ATPase [Planctomycetota bacterium]|nr:PilT/PilU family type 4a pilus ATPase [Planctomycetota bacterium]